MGTRGVIARRIDESSFSGVYHHWDSYPSGLGASLWRAYHASFDRSLERMLEFLLSHSWSTIVGKDLALQPGWGTSIEDAPACYCHGERSESVCRFTESNAASSGCEYCYTFYTENGRDRMCILSSHNSDNSKMIGAFGMGNPDAIWQPVAGIGEIDLLGSEPEWCSFD